MDWALIHALIVAIDRHEMTVLAAVLISERAGFIITDLLPKAVPSIQQAFGFEGCVKGGEPVLFGVGMVKLYFQKRLGCRFGRSTRQGRKPQNSLRATSSNGGLTTPNRSIIFGHI